MLRTIENMLKVLNDRGIRYCHWKSNEHLKEALNGDTDLDMLFDPSQRTELEQALDICGMKRFRAVPLMQYNAIEDFIGFDQNTSKIWHLHTHYRMTLGEKHLKGYTVTPWGKYILDNRVIGEEEVYVAAPEIELILLLFRIALKLRGRDTGRKLGKDDSIELAWLLERIDPDKLEETAVQMAGKKTASIIAHMMEQPLTRKSQFVKLQKELRGELRWFTSYSRMTSWFVRSVREVFWLYGGVRRRLGFCGYTASRRISPSGGCVVAILWCDGAGKSTTLDYVRKEFGKKLDVAAIYFGSGDGSCSWFRRPMKLVAQRVGGRGLGHSVEKEYRGGGRVSMKSRAYSAAKVLWAVSLAREKEKKLRQMVRARNNGMLVLTDRYPQSNMPGYSDGPLLSRYKEAGGILRRLYEWETDIYRSASVNPPDLTIKLMVPTEVAISRKPEMTQEEIEAKKHAVMEMDISEHVVVIDTSRPFGITRGEVMKEIWNLI